MALNVSEQDLANILNELGHEKGVSRLLSNNNVVPALKAVQEVSPYMEAPTKSR